MRVCKEKEGLGNARQMCAHVFTGLIPTNPWRKRKEGNKRKSFPPPLPGPLPELQFPLGGNGDARPACAWSSPEHAAKSETAPRDSPIPTELGAKGRSGSCWLGRMAAHQKSSLSG